MAKLAMRGGPRAVPEKIRKIAWPIITEEDKRGVMAVLDRGVMWAMTTVDGLTCPEQDALEKEFAQFVGSRHALAVNGGTAAIHMALVGAGVQAGDEVITPAFSFLATPAAILHAAAIPVFVDVEPRTWNIDPALIEARITPRTRAILAVDIHGVCADWEALAAIARKHNLLLIEDACQAPGAAINGRSAGTFGNAAAFSVNGTKNFAVGEGGFMVTDDDEIYYRANWIKQVGETLPETDRTMEFQHLLAWNYRVQEMPCAFGRSQLRRLAEVNATGRRNAGIVDGYLEKTKGLRAPFVPEGYTSVYHKYRISIVPEELDTPLRGQELRDALMAALAAEGVDVDLWGTAPLPAHPMIASRYGYGRQFPWSLDGNSAGGAYRAEDFPATLHMFANSFCLGNDVFPIYAQPEEVAHAWGEALQKVARDAAELAPSKAWQTAT
jgi:perosamine synthetase